MKEKFKIIGTGYCLGNVVVNNFDLAEKMNLGRNWFADHLGTHERRICSEDQDVISMAVESVRSSVKNSGLELKSLDRDCLLIHIQNGFTYLTPPPGIQIANKLGLYSLKTISLDGVCAEPVNAIEIAALMLGRGLYKRIIISASVDFLFIINPEDKDTAGLFGAGAGSMILEAREEGASGLYGLNWESRSDYYDLGLVKFNWFEKLKDSVNLNMSYYEMKGKNLATVALQVAPKTIQEALKQAGMTAEDINYVVAHQPNDKLLDIGIKYSGLSSVQWFRTSKNLGNLGPASLLITFAIEMEKGSISDGQNICFFSFGLGFSCGAAIIKM